MITSWPRETRSVPSVSGASIACPPGLSVIESTSTRGSAASSRASSSTWRLAVRRDQAAARDELGGDDERAGSCELFAERGHLGGPIANISLPDLSSPHGRPAGARRRDGADGGIGLRRDRPRLGARAPGGLRRRAARPDGRGDARRRRSPRSRRVADGELAEHAGTPDFLLGARARDRGVLQRLRRARRRRDRAPGRRSTSTHRSRRGWRRTGRTWGSA